MKISNRLQSWVRAMEDIEDPAGNELRRLRKHIRTLEAVKAVPANVGKRDAL